jgi:predicted MFS family arabinose efflux permease
MAIIGDVFPDQRRGTATGALMSAFALASVVGVPVGLELGTRFDWHAPFLVLAALGAPVLAIAFWVMPTLNDHLTSGHRGGAPEPRSLAKITETLFHPPHMRAFALIIMLMFGAFAVIPYISSYLVANVGVENSELKWVFIVGGLCTLVSSPIVGRLADRFGKLRVYRVMAPMSAVMMLVITTLPRVGLLASIAAVSGLMISNSGRMVAAMAMITGAVEPRRRGGFMTANSSLQHMATGLGAFVGGLIIVKADDGSWQHYGTVGLLGATATLITLWLAGRLRPAEPGDGAAAGPASEGTSTVMCLEAAAEASVDFEPLLQVSPRKSVA